MNIAQLLSIVMSVDVFEASIEDDIIYFNEGIQYWDEISKYFKIVYVEKEITTDCFMKRCKYWFVDNKNLSIFSGKRILNDQNIFEAIVLNTDLNYVSVDSEEDAVFNLCIQLLGENNE